MDSLKLSDDFRTAGFTDKKARALAEKFTSLASDHLVTREYLDFKLREMQYKMTISLGGLIVATLAFFKMLEHYF